MVRQIGSYALTTLILLSQVGMPLHMHYCKGILESVSVFFNAGCNDHHDEETISSCCENFIAGHCTTTDGACCDDEVTLITQGVASLLPQVSKWLTIPFIFEYAETPEFPVSGEIQNPHIEIRQDSDSGPPKYIWFHSLILYA